MCLVAFLKMKRALLFNLGFYHIGLYAEGYVTLTHGIHSVMFMFIGVHRSKYLKRRVREANNIGKECASFFTLRKWFCNGFSYYKLAETY